MVVSFLIEKSYNIPPHSHEVLGSRCFLDRHDEFCYYILVALEKPDHKAAWILPKRKTRHFNNYTSTCSVLYIE